MTNLPAGSDAYPPDDDVDDDRPEPSVQLLDRWASILGRIAPDRLEDDDLGELSTLLTWAANRVRPDVAATIRLKVGTSAYTIPICPEHRLSMLRGYTTNRHHGVKRADARNVAADGAFCLAAIGQPGSVSHRRPERTS